MSESLDLFDRSRNESSLRKNQKKTQDSRIRINWYSPIYNMHMYWTKQKPEVVAEYIKKYCPPGGTVLDAFSGSGMTGVGALISRRNAICSDLSPLCEFLSKNFSSKVDSEILRRSFYEIIEKIEHKFDWLYRTKCQSCDNSDAKIYSLIWADNFSCPKCDHVQNMCANDEHLKLKKGEKITHIKCYDCGTSYKKEMKFFHSNEVIAIEVECDRCGLSGKNNTRCPNRTDQTWLKKIDSYRIHSFYPKDVEFQYGINTKRCLLRDITHPCQIFSKMNLIFLSSYWSEVKSYGKKKRLSKKMVSKLHFIATSAMFHGSLMRRWLPYRGGVPLKGTLFVPSMSEDIRFSRVLRYQAERVFKGQDAINSITGNGKVKTKISSATSLSWIKNNSVDYLYYDPPFGGHINYSELNIVWEAWLGKKTNTKEEAIVNRHQGKDMDDYGTLLARSLEEGTKKLKNGGHLTIVFAHSDLKIWRLLQEAVHDLPLQVQGGPRVLDSANKTFIQLYSNKAQQNMIAFTFKKKKIKKSSLVSDFHKKIEFVIHRAIQENPEGFKREDIFDYITQEMFSTSYFESFDLDAYLQSNFSCANGIWTRKGTFCNQKTGTA